MKTVVKVNGKVALRKNCVKFIEGFYQKGKEAVNLDNKWYRVSSTDKVAFDHSVSDYCLTGKNNLRFGLVGKDGKEGYFSDPNEEVVKYKTNRYALNEKVLEDNDYVESINSEYWVSKHTKQQKTLGPKYNDGDKLPYNLDFFSIQKLYISYDKEFKSTLRDVFLQRFLEGYKFGSEFETSNGYIRKRKLSMHGVMPLLDGSLRREDGSEPYEFTTIPYEKVKGAETLRSFCDVLDLHCEFDLNCSNHIHISGYPGGLNNALVLYKVLFDIQNDIFKMFPKYKEDPNYNPITKEGKNYCEKLPDIFSGLNVKTLGYKNYKNALASRMFTKLTGYSLDSDRNFARGGSLFEGINKWDILGRYKWVNLIPLMFSDNHTVEFRIHEPSFDKELVTNWLLFCISILDYAKKHTNMVFKRTVKLDDIFNSSIYGTKLREYYLTRKEFYTSANKREDYTALIKTCKPII